MDKEYQSEFEGFVSSVKEAMQFCEWMDVEPPNDSDFWRYSITLADKKYFVLYKKIGYHFKTKTGELRKNFDHLYLK